MGKSILTINSDCMKCGKPCEESQFIGPKPWPHELLSLCCKAPTIRRRDPIEVRL